MKMWWAQRWQRLLMIAWRVLDRLRRSIALSQVWLEKRITGWGGENTFVASTSSEIMFEDNAPEHWAALVRKNAPWLLRPGRDTRSGTRQAMSSGERHRDSVLLRHSDRQQSRHGDTPGFIYQDDVNDYDFGAVGEALHDTAEQFGSDRAVASPIKAKSSSSTRRVSPKLRATMAGDISEERCLEEELAVDGLNNPQSIDADVSQSGEATGSHLDFIRHDSRIDEQKTSLADTNTDALHVNPENKKQKYPFVPKTPQVETITVSPVWPLLPDEKGEAGITDKRWPSLDLDSMTDGDDSFAQQEGVEWH